MKTDWTKELEEQVLYIGNCSQGYIWMFNREIQKLSNLSWYLSNLSISLGVISGGLSGISLVTNDNTLLIAFSTGFSFTAAITQGLLKKFNFETKIAEYKRHISKHSGLLNNIKRQLGLPQNKREKAEDYCRWISKNYDDLIENNLIIRENIIKEYKDICKEKNILFPDDTKEIKIFVKEQIEYKEENKENKEENKENKNNKEEYIEKINTLKRAENAVLFSDTNMQYELNRLKQQNY